MAGKNNEYVKKCRSKLSKSKKAYLNQYYCRSWKAWIGRYTNMSLIEDRRRGRKSSITLAYIDMLLRRNDKRCCMTNMEIRHDKSLWSMSIDRIDNSIGHIIGNVQLVTRAANLAKNRHTNDDLVLFLDNLVNPVFKPDKPSRDYISSCIGNHQRRDREKGLKCNITTNHILAMMEQQRGVCYLTGVSMAAYKHPMFSLSVDRINNDRGHTVDNVRLVIKSINTAKRDHPDNEITKWIDDVRANYVK